MVTAVDATHPLRISVVVSTLDRPQLLSRCLDALLAGTRLPQEVIVVDQGGADAVRDVLDARCRRGVPLVHVVQVRRGLSVSQNAGVARASGTVVLIVDDDCVPDVGWVEVAAREHALSEGPLLLTGRVLALPADGERVLPLSLRASTTRAVLPPDVLPWDIGTGGNFAVSRVAYLRVGGNDERLGTGSTGRAGNDLDLFRRLLRDGVEARYEPDLLVRHERATKAEHIGRRWTYGFGVGACVTLWWSQGDPAAWHTLRAWVRLRIQILGRVRRPIAAANEARVLLGTVHGLWFGWRLGKAGPPRPGST